MRMGDFRLSEGSAVLNSLIWQTQGWTHSPSANKFKLPANPKIKVSRPTHISEKHKLFFNYAFDPKVQVPKFYPHGELPKAVVVEELKRKYSHLDRHSILQSLNINPILLFPSRIFFRKKALLFHKENITGPSTLPYLDLFLFDDTEFEQRTPEEWMALGEEGKIKKAIPGMAYLPHKYRIGCDITFDWQDVAVLRYCPQIDMYLVRRITDCPKEGIVEITLKTLENSEVGPFDDIWVPRIYLTFFAEDPRLFAERFSSAVSYRHKVEESLRFCFYIDCMPVDGLPHLNSDFINKIMTIACSCPSKFSVLEWVKKKLSLYAHDIELTYQRTLNYHMYQEITSQKPCLVDIIPKMYKKSCLSGYKKHYSFKNNMASFVNKTYWTRKEVIQALHVVQEQMLLLLEKPLYNIPLPHILPVDEFVVIQKSTLNEVTEFIHSRWIANVTNGIKEKLHHCGKGYYNLHEVDWYVYEHSKLKKLMTTVSFMMQDTTRTLVIDALKKYTQLIREACHNVMDLPDNFVWTEGFDSTKRGPLKAPLFQIEAVLKSIHLEFANDLHKCHDLVINLFNDALGTTTGISHPEKFVMEQMLIAEQRILETVGVNEAEVISWRQVVVTGMDKAILAMEAYAKSYDSALSYLALDRITYIKNCERQKKKYGELKELIEYHMKEKKNLSETIPDSVDIGPFRLVTRSVKLTAVKKHETLAEALLEYFSSKLREHMEDINHKFINLQEQIKLPSGNIEYLLEQEKWFDTVPSEIENLTVSVKQLREDYKNLADFYCGFCDDEFSLYWEVIGLPYNTTLILEHRIQNLDNEKEYLRTLLYQDQAQLKSKIEELTERIADFSNFLDLEKSSAYQINVRQTRKDVENCQELAVLYNMRESLFDIPTTSYDMIEELFRNLEPYELLWYSVADFYKWQERDQSGMDMQIDEDQLKTIIEESYVKLCNCLELFHEPAILKIIISVRNEMDEYRFSRFNINIPEHKNSNLKNNG